MLKKIIIVVAILAVAGVATGLYMWNKPPHIPKSGIPISSVILTKEYQNDEKLANSKYLNKDIEVSGIISAVSNNQDGEFIITLDSGDPLSEVQCTMRDKNLKVTKGQNVTIIGTCTGNNMGVILTKCALK